MRPPKLKAVPPSVKKAEMELLYKTNFNPAKPYAADRLNDVQKQMLVESVYNLKPMFDVAKKLGFATKSEFNKWLWRQKDLRAEIEEAKLNACEILEEKMLNLDNKKQNPKTARVMLESYAKVLGYRKPEKYGQKVSLDINQTVSIEQNLLKANERVAGLIKDVSPIQITGETKESKEE